jgi:hypothetical protein
MTGATIRAGGYGSRLALRLAGTTAENEARPCILAAHLAPELCPSSHPLKSEGAGKTGRWPRPWPACNTKSRRQSPQVWPNTPGLPCAMVLTLIRDLPGDRLSCPRRPHARHKQQAWHQHRDARTTRFRRPQQPVRRRSQNSAAHCRVHRIPHPTSVTIAIRPSGGTEWADDKPDLGQARSNLCFSEGIDRVSDGEVICPSGAEQVSE